MMHCRLVKSSCSPTTSWGLGRSVFKPCEGAVKFELYIVHCTLLFVIHVMLLPWQRPSRGAHAAVPADGKVTLFRVLKVSGTSQNIIGLAIVFEPASLTFCNKFHPGVLVLPGRTSFNGCPVPESWCSLGWLPSYCDRIQANYMLAASRAFEHAFGRLSV